MGYMGNLHMYTFLDGSILETGLTPRGMVAEATDNAAPPRTSHTPLVIIVPPKHK